MRNALLQNTRSKAPREGTSKKSDTPGTKEALERIPKSEEEGILSDVETPSATPSLTGAFTPDPAIE